MARPLRHNKAPMIDYYCNDRYYANIFYRWWWMVCHCSITTWISNKSLTRVRVIPDLNTQACAHTDRQIHRQIERRCLHHDYTLYRCTYLLLIDPVRCPECFGAIIVVLSKCWNQRPMQYQITNSYYHYIDP